MSIVKDIDCMFFCKDKNDEIKGAKLKCNIVNQSGSISCGVDKLEVRFLVDEQVLIETVRKNTQVETEGVWMRFIDDNIIPIKCMINIDVMPGATMFNVVGILQFIAIKNEVLKEVLNI